MVRIMQLFSTSIWNVLAAFFLSMVPVLELRAAIPMGIAAGMPPMAAYLVAVLGNMVPVPLVILLARRIFDWLRKKTLFRARIEALERRVHLKGRIVRKYRLLGLVLLVAIPIPGTGAWTGALTAAFLDIAMRRSIPAILLGVLIAGVITTAITCGVIHFF